MHVHVNARVNVISVIQGLVCCCKLWIEMFSRGNLVLVFLSHRLLEYSRVNWQSPYRRVMTSIISFGSEVEAQLGKRLQASVVRQMKASEMATQWTLLYHLTSRLRVLLQSAPSKRLLFEYYVKQLLKNQ